MLFLIGINQMTRDEKIMLLAQMNAVSGWNLLSQGAQKLGIKAKSLAFKGGDLLVDTLGVKNVHAKIKELDQSIDWDPNVLNRKIEAEAKELRLYRDEGLDQKLHEKMASLAGIPETSEKDAVARSILERVGISFEKNPAAYANVVALEEDVFSACLQEQIEALQKKLNSLSREEHDELEEMLRAEIQKLSAADQEQIRDFAGLDELSSQAILKLLKTSSSAVLVQMLIAGTGFGAYLFLTTVMKAVSLLLGSTFPFAAYTAGAVALSFLLSGPFLILILAASTGFVLKKTNEKIDLQMAKILIIAGRAKMMELDRQLPIH